jgi:type 1 glutamine amidotransferase
MKPLSLQNSIHPFGISTRGLALAAGLLAAAFLLSATSVNAADDTPRTRVVLIAGPVSHPSGQHEFHAGSILLARALNEQSGLPIDVEVIQNGWPEDESVFEGASAIVFYSDGNDRHPAMGHEETVDALVDQGVGIMCMHYGVEVPAGPRGEYFKKWIGGHYESGFSCNPHWTADATVNSDHPVGQGVPQFKANDEWYYKMRFADPKTAVDVLTATPTREQINRYIHWTPAGESALGKKQAMMWAVERPDGGRGVGFTGGHWHRNWAIDDFRRLVLNGIIWTAGLDVPEGGVISAPVTEPQLNENLDEKKDMVHVSLPSEADLTQPAADPIDYRWPGYPPKKKK